MENNGYASRADVPLQFRWNEESVYPSLEAWEADLNRVLADISRLDNYRGQLGERPNNLREVFDLYQNLLRRGGKVGIYGALKHYVDTNDPNAARLFGQAQGLYGRLGAALSFIDPELLAVGKGRLEAWMEAEPDLAVYRHYLDDLFRRGAHVRSPEVEELLGSLLDPFTGTETTRNLLVDGELKFAPARGIDGTERPVTQGEIQELLASPDRELRRTAWESYSDGHWRFKNTLANNLLTSVKQDVFLARARHFSTSLDAALDQNNIPTQVVRNTLDAFRRRLPTWHRYWKIRRQGLGLSDLHTYDIWAPLTRQAARVSYDQAVEWVLAGLAPLGEDYVRAARKGLLEERWVDVYPTPGKSSMEFSYGWPGTHPFIVMNYDNTIFSLSTLAHELGHAMHSYLSWRSQPMIYAQYSIFAAEVASNFHQALVRESLLKTHTDREFQISVIEEALSNFHRYFFIMPLLASFELDVHERVERGQGLSADDLNELMRNLYSEGYGTEVTLEPERDGITWATFSHLYRNFYVYQYITGISGAHALAQHVLAGEPGVVERYLKFLGAGGSQYPLDALRQAGIDLASPQPVEETFDLLDGMLDRLEGLLAGR
jgi:oligoendopeptidase F